MGHKVNDGLQTNKKKMENKEDIFDGSEDLNVIDLLKRMHKQMIFLERKVDRLMNILENKPDKNTFHSKFSRGYSRDEENRFDGDRKEKKRSFGKQSGDKKKGFFAKKNTDKYQGKKVKKVAK